MKQITFLERDDNSQGKYTTAAGSPLYVPKDRRPNILSLRDTSRMRILMTRIEESTVTPDEKLFLIDAAQRHTVFNYELIADYYSHATPEMQRLMEASALVIIDIDQAIERGYVRLCETIRALHMEENMSDV
jgi:hypothetical protein